MKKTYFIIPSNKSIWNSDAIISQLSTMFTTKEDAITIAETLSRQYNADFFVCSLETKVSTKVSLVDLI